ncbi:MAG: hypothetical protein U0894_19865 [Pirellulales bacterium]
MMGLNNWQKYEAYDETILRNATRGFTTTGGSTTGSSIILDTRKTNPVSNSGNEFVFGGELRMEAACEVTRDISLRAGFMYMLLGHGVARQDRSIEHRFHCQRQPRSLHGWFDLRLDDQSLV